MQSHSINENSLSKINFPSLNNMKNNLINDRLSDSNNSINDFEQQILNQDKTEPSNKSSQNCNYLTNIFFDLKQMDTDRYINIRGSKYEIKKVDLNISSFSFSLYKNKKRGRTTNIFKKEYSHTALDFDNLLTKIQVHYITFIINLSNDALITEFGKNYKHNFKQIAIKRKISYDYFNSLKSTKIENILQMKISDKYEYFPKNCNIIIFKEVCKSQWLKNFFKMKYLDLFNIYYNNEQYINKITFENKDIFFSKKTKPFYDLLKSKKNKNITKELIKTAKAAYFDKTYNMNDMKHLFITNK